MSPVNPPAAQQGYQPMQLLAGQSPYMQNPFPCQGQVGYPPQLYQPQVPLNPWEADQGRFSYLPQPYQPQLLQNPWDAGQGQFGHLLQYPSGVFQQNDRVMEPQNVAFVNINNNNNSYRDHYNSFRGNTKQYVKMVCQKITR